MTTSEFELLIKNDLLLRSQEYVSSGGVKENLWSSRIDSILPVIQYLKVSLIEIHALSSVDRSIVKTQLRLGEKSNKVMGT